MEPTASRRTIQLHMSSTRQPAAARAPLAAADLVLVRRTIDNACDATHQNFRDGLVRGGFGCGRTVLSRCGGIRSHRARRFGGGFPVRRWRPADLRSSQEWRTGKRCSFPWDLRRWAYCVRCQARGAHAWRKQLREAGIPIEREVDWDEGGRSLYFRDPAGNIVELAPLTIWGGGWEF